MSSLFQVRIHPSLVLNVILLLARICPHSYGKLLYPFLQDILTYSVAYAPTELRNTKPRHLFAFRIYKTWRHYVNCKLLAFCKNFMFAASRLRGLAASKILYKYFWPRERSKRSEWSTHFAASYMPFGCWNWNMIFGGIWIHFSKFSERSRLAAWCLDA